MTDEKHSRLVLLNHLISDSKSRASQEHKPPFHPGDELLRILESRSNRGLAIEFFDGERNDSADDATRIAEGVGHDFIRLKTVRFLQLGSRRYVVMLIDAIDRSIRSMPVLHLIHLTGRDIVGDEHERGSFSAHVVVRLPDSGAYDDGNYRCVVEASSGITRKSIEILLRRQLRRYAKNNDFRFEVEREGKRGPRKPQSYEYRPTFALASDVGRSILGEGRELSHLVFTKRSERLEISEKTSVIQDDVVGDVELRISAKQAPKDAEEQAEWLAGLKEWYETRGFKTKLYFRHIGGRTIGGALHQSVQSAADIMLCQREEIFTDNPPRRWVDEIQPDVRDAMIAILDRDDLWKRSAG